MSGRSSRHIAAVMLLALASGCSRVRTVAPDDAAFFANFDRKLYPVAGSAMSNIPAYRRMEIRLVQSVLKPEYRSRLAYTYTNDGIFVVIASYGRPPHAGGVEVNGCHTPPDAGQHPTCYHDCGLALQEQFWTVGTLMENRCADDAPIWLHPHGPLPQFERPPAVLGAAPTP